MVVKTNEGNDSDWAINVGIGEVEASVDLLRNSSTLVCLGLVKELQHANQAYL